MGVFWMGMGCWSLEFWTFSMPIFALGTVVGLFVLPAPGLYTSKRSLWLFGVQEAIIWFTIGYRRYRTEYTTWTYDDKFFER